MKKLMKIGLATVALLGVSEYMAVAGIAIAWNDLMMSNEDAAADALDNVAKKRANKCEVKLYEVIKTYLAETYLNH